MTSLQSHLPAKLIRALYGISREKSLQIRARVLEASLKEVFITMVYSDSTSITARHHSDSASNETFFFLTELK